MISAYAPQGGKTQEEKEEFLEVMDDSIGNISENDILGIGRDLNGHVGRDRNGYEDVVVIDGYGERNADGENILEICQSRQLKILNTMFKKEDKIWRNMASLLTDKKVPQRSKGSIYECCIRSVMLYGSKT